MASYAEMLIESARNDYTEFNDKMTYLSENLDIINEISIFSTIKTADDAKNSLPKLKLIKIKQQQKHGYNI